MTLFHQSRHVVTSNIIITIIKGPHKPSDRDNIPWVTIRLSLVMIITVTSLKCLLLQDGESPLHVACRYYKPSYHNSIDICVILIEAGANHQKRNRVSLTLSESYYYLQRFLLTMPGLNAMSCPTH